MLTHPGPRQSSLRQTMGNETIILSARVACLVHLRGGESELTVGSAGCELANQVRMDAWIGVSVQGSLGVTHS